MAITLIPAYIIEEEAGERAVIIESGFANEYVVVFENSEGFASSFHMTGQQIKEVYGVDTAALFEAM